jgi:hypothetical protein
MHRDTGTAVDVENYFWNGEYGKNQTILVASGPDLPEPVIIVGTSRLKIWKGNSEDADNDVPYAIVKEVTKFPIDASGLNCR